VLGRGGCKPARRVAARGAWAVVVSALMRIRILVIFLVTFGVGFCPAATDDFDSLVGKIRIELSGTDWQIVTDRNSITLTTTNVQFLYQVSLPLGMPEKELWDRFSVRSDYRITITFDTKLTQEEYDDLFRLRRTFTAKRTAGLDPRTKDFFGRSIAAEGVVRLPTYYLDYASIYLYTSDTRFQRIRPDSVHIARDNVVALLEQFCLKYSTPAEAAGAANGPARSNDDQKVVTRRFLLDQGFIQSTNDPTHYTLKGVTVAQAAVRLGFSMKDLVRGTNNPPDQDIRLVVIRDYEFALVSEPQKNSAGDALSNPQAICTVEARLIPALRRPKNPR